MTRTEEILRNRHGGAYSRAVPKETAMRFDGATFDQARDGARLGDQMAAVFDLMKDGQPRTLPAISFLIDAPEASVSARLRDLRKPRFGAHCVERTYIDRGLFSYRLIVREAEAA